MNKNAERIRDAVIAYQGIRKTADEKIKYIRDTYGDEAGDAEARIQGKRLEQERAKAEDAIKTAYRDGHMAASGWGTLDGSKLTDDTKLLDAGLVDAEAFNGMKVRYKDNSTMLAALRKYGETQNATAIKDGGIPAFETRDIPTAEAKMKKWDNLQTQAFEILDAMDGKNPDDWNTAFLTDQEIINHFGEDL